MGIKPALEILDSKSIYGLRQARMGFDLVEQGLLISIANKVSL